MNVNFILYVGDQLAATAFYRATLDLEPQLDVPGMTEFRIGEDAVLGLMPERGIMRLLGPVLGDPSSCAGVPRCEVYLTVDDPERYLSRAVDAGARLLSEVAPRDWGHRVGYCADLDGHVVAFGG